MRSVAWLSFAPVKGLRLRLADSVRIERFGVAEDRRFYLIDSAGDRVGALEHGRLLSIEADYQASTDRLELRLPSGEVVSGEVELGDAVTTNFFGRPVPGHLVRGPWSETVSSVAGVPLRLVQTDEPGVGVDREDGTVSLVSEASLEELRRRSGRERPVDGRRFRMLIGIAGCRAHEEDEWIGRDVQVGEAVVRPIETIARCAITTKDPETGERDFDTLRAIREYRGKNPETMGLDFGVFGTVVRPGDVSVGDRVEPLERLDARWLGAGLRGWARAGQATVSDTIRPRRDFVPRVSQRAFTARTAVTVASWDASCGTRSLVAPTTSGAAGATDNASSLTPSTT